MKFWLSTRVLFGRICRCLECWLHFILHFRVHLSRLILPLLIFYYCSIASNFLTFELRSTCSKCSSCWHCFQCTHCAHCTAVNLLCCLYLLLTLASAVAAYCRPTVPSSNCRDKMRACLQTAVAYNWQDHWLESCISCWQLNMRIYLLTDKKLTI